MPPPRYGQADPRHLAQLYAALIPDKIAKSLSSAEYNDRLTEAARLSRQAADPALPPALRQAAKLRAQAVLRAQPRDITTRQHRELVAKAAAVRNPAQADAIRRQAERLIEEEQPPAPRSWSPSAVVAKAKANGQLLACFDQAGNLWGVADPDDVQTVEGHEGDGTPPAASPGGALPGDGSQVAKAKAKAKNAGMKAVFDQQHRLIGIVDPDDVTPVITTLPAAAAAVAKARATLIAGAPRTPVAKATLSQPHRYARDVRSHAGACACGRPLGHSLHTDIAPGIPIPASKRIGR